MNTQPYDRREKSSISNTPLLHPNKSSMREMEWQNEFKAHARCIRLPPGVRQQELNSTTEDESEDSLVKWSFSFTVSPSKNEVSQAFTSAMSVDVHT